MKNLLLIAFFTFLAISVSAQDSVPQPAVTPSQRQTVPTNELTPKIATSISDIKDVKPNDVYYEPLKNLTDQWGIVYVYEDSTFRPNEPLTRIQFAIFVQYGLDTLLSIGSSSSTEINIYDIFSSFPANNKFNSMKQIKDIPPDYPYYAVVQRLYEDYDINLGDSDGYFRPNKQMSEKEMYEALTGIFIAGFNTQPSATKTVSRGKFVTDLSFILDYKAKQIQDVGKGAENDAKLKIINSLPAKGKAKITSFLKAYSPNNTCIDFKAAGRQIEEAALDGGIWGDYKIKNDDIGDIVFEGTNTCRKGKIVLLRIGTAIVTMTEEGIKRLK